VSSLRESWLRRSSFDQQAWDRAVRAILPDVHPVDRVATLIWFHFWPLKLARLARDADRIETVRRYKLDGRFLLSEQLDESVEMFYGHRYWPEVKGAVSAHGGRPEHFESESPEGLLRENAERAALDAGAPPALVLGITAVATMALQQLGDLDLPPGRAGSTPRRGRSPEAVLAGRRGRRGGGLPRLLGRPKHTITWDERAGRRFRTLDGQNLTMAAARDPEDHCGLDPRRVAGPIPVQCRSGACGYCWVGVIAGSDSLSAITPFERKRLEEFGYAEHAEDEAHPPVRLACQCAVSGDATLVIPPWNGVLHGRT